MANLNKTLLVGNLVKDVETQYTKRNNTPYTRFTIALDGPRNQDGDRRTDFASCVAFGRMAENLGKVGRKGRLIYLDGHIRSSHFTDRNGNEQYSMNVATNYFDILTPRNNNGSPSQDTGNTQNTANENGSNQNTQSKSSDDDDLEPF